MKTRDGEGVQQVTEHLGEAASAAKAAARAGLESLREGAVDYYEQGKQRLETLETKLRKRVQSEPIKSLVVAAAVGIVFGWIWKRR